MKGLLVIVPCGQKKAWDADPKAGAVAACDAYTGAPFKVNRRYAEKFAERWVILSAKYGLVLPEFQIPGPYNVTFKKKSSLPVELDTLCEQMRTLRLNTFSTVVGLGGKEYREIIAQCLNGSKVELQFPFAGLPIGKMMRAINRAIESNDPFAIKETKGRDSK